ncbi:MAG: M4 family peptidase [Proteobacteria bacterium]|nr:M4 family peptidase [Pseudomonadota bacterium]
MKRKLELQSILTAFMVAGVTLTSCKQTTNQNAEQPPLQEEPAEADPEAALALVNTGAKALADITAQPGLVPHDTDQKFTPKSVILDPDGTEHVRFTRTYKGLSVVGGDFVVHRTQQGTSTSLNKVGIRATKVNAAGSSTPAVADGKINVNVVPKISAQEAQQNARTHFAGKLSKVKDAQLLVFSHNKTPTLAWEVGVMGKNPKNAPSDLRVFIDAQTGRLLAKWEKVHTAAGTGRGVHTGTTKLEVQFTNGFYRLLDETRGRTQSGDMKGLEDAFDAVQKPLLPFAQRQNIFGNFKAENMVSIAADVQFGGIAAWDYFLKNHGRRGAKNDGKGMPSRFNYGVQYANAFYHPDCDCLTYGNGDGGIFKPLTSLDVAVHEFSHAVTRHTADLIYYGESGGLNEATSDIFAALAEFYFNLPSDPPDYLIGEKIVMPGILSNDSLRTMYKPSLDGASPDCYSDEVDFLDVHYSSGIANHFFYLLAEGSKPAGMPESPTCNGSTIKGIGREKAGKIWYRALTAYMNPSTDYSGAKFATLRAAHDLFGVNSLETRTVGAAWAAVKLPNLPPVLPKVVSVSAKKNVETKIPLNITDEDSPINCKESLVVSSSNTKLLPLKNIVLSGKAPECVMTVTPIKNISGAVNISIEVSDEKNKVSNQVPVTVK